MRIQLLIATNDDDYSEYLLNVLSVRFTDTFVVGLCSSQEKLSDILLSKKYDIILVEPEWIKSLNRQNVKLVFALLSEQSSLSEQLQNVVRVEKYQRISTLVCEILEQYASVAHCYGGYSKDNGLITAVWSPAGGVGKTSVALAFAARAVSNGKTVIYLDLEHFSSVDAYFAEEGKSISALFEKLTSNAELLVNGIRQHEKGSGIDFFNPPNNYDDINELTKEDIVSLTNTCASACNSVIVDLPSVCDKRTQAVLELANIVLLVSDDSKTAVSKLNAFVSQHSVFEGIKHKTWLVSNRGARLTDSRFEKIVNLPHIQTSDPIGVYKTLSGNSFDM